MAEPTQAGPTGAGLANGAASAVGALLAFAVTVIITRRWGAEVTGVVFAGLTVLMIIGTIAKLGAETALVLFVSRNATSTIDRRLLAVAILPVLGVSVAAAASVYVVAEPLAEVLVEPAWRSDLTRILRRICWFVPAWSVSLCLLGATRGAGTMRPTILGLNLAQPALQVGAIAAVAATDAAPSTIALAWAAPTAVTLVVGAAAVARRVGTTPAPPSGAEFWRFATPRGAAASMQTALDRFGLLFVSALAPVALAGQWATITRVIGLAQRVFHAIGQALNPAIGGPLSRGDHDRVGTAATSMTTWTLAVLAPVLMGVAWFPAAALELFGEEFTGGAPALTIAALVTLAATVLAFADNVLLMSGRSATAMVITATSLTAALVGYRLLVPGLELVGAALALAIGALIYRGGSAIVVGRDLGIRVADRAALKLVGAAVVLVSVVGLAARAVAGDRLTTALVAGVVVAVVWPAGLSRTGLPQLVRRPGAAPTTS